MNWTTSFIVPVILLVAYLAPSPMPDHLQQKIIRLFVSTSQDSHTSRFNFEQRNIVDVELRKLRSLAHVFHCPSNEEAQTYFTTGTYKVVPGTADGDNWAKFFQDYMGVPYTSEWEDETWNYLFVYPGGAVKQNNNPTHFVMVHWHRFTDYTPSFNGIDEYLLFASPLNGNTAKSKNPYTEWGNMGAVVGMAPVWTNRWRSNSSIGGGGPQFGCPALETSLQLISFRGKDIRRKNVHWVLYREVMQDGMIYASVRWIQVTDSCSHNYQDCPPFDPIHEGLFGSPASPKYVTRMFEKVHDNPYVKESMRQPSLVFEDDEYLAEISSYTDTKIFAHEYFNRSTYVRKLKGFGYTGYNHSTPGHFATS